MNAKEMTDDELLAWAANIIREAQQQQHFAKITIHTHNGKIVRVETVRSHKPD